MKVVIPQDEFLYTDILCDFIKEFRVTCIYSSAPASEWPKIYSGVDLKHVEVHRVLTGYLDEQTLDRIEELQPITRQREVDIGYRGWRSAPWLGRHGTMKTRIAEAFRERVVAMGMSCDISVDDKDTLLGERWYKFLLKCKYTIGVEGGASIIDTDGSIRERTEDYLAENPDAPFDDIERSCFPGKEGSLQLYALSPRHLEACVTRTCQVLIEGSYNGVLIPGEHYIPLKADFSNLDEVLALMMDDEHRETMVERAYADIVRSGRYSSQRFVEAVLLPFKVNPSVTLCGMENSKN